MVKRFDTGVLLEDMYNNSYYPDFLVDKIFKLLSKLVFLIEKESYDIKNIQNLLDITVFEINDMKCDFIKSKSHIDETAAKSIEVSLSEILIFYNIPIEITDALRMRDW